MTLEQIEIERARFEARYEPMGFDMTRYQCAAVEPWSEYASMATGYAWAGWIAAKDDAATAWQSIESAPKNKESLIWFSTLFGGRIDIGLWNSDKYAKRPRPYWCGAAEAAYGVNAYRNGTPAHWMPLPSAPTPGSKNV